ncbi:hypothetical protein KR009_009746, partial [Drosophila setifemur]
LSANELVAHRHTEFEPLTGGLKRTQNNGSASELDELKRAQDNLRAQLSIPRIERLGGRALATWNEEQQVAEVQRKDGKFENFGYSDGGKLYLEYYEALFLLELVGQNLFFILNILTNTPNPFQGRLQLEYHGTVVSIEQAYVLLLGELESEKYTNYLVYSALSRAGYIVVRHKVVEQTPISSGDCIWALLKDKLGNEPLPALIRSSPHFGQAEQRMEELTKLIKLPNTDKPEIPEGSLNFKFDTRKRRATSEPSEEPTSKKERFSITKRSLVDHQQVEHSISKFEDLFIKFDIVKLDSKDYNPDDSPSASALKIIFDLHSHNEGFKKRSPKAPCFNVIILPPRGAFPTHEEIFKMQNHQTAPLLVISVSESKQIQAFLYYIS